jgi:outer membrane protein assembly factor BamB
MKIDKKDIIQIISGLKWSSAAAALVIGVLLFATAIQTKIHNPVVGNDFTNIYQLVDKNPADQNLRDEVRALDMLARKAYFTSVYQLKIGTIIFFIALGLFLILWNIQAALSPPRPSIPNEKISWWSRQTQSSKTAAIASAAIITISILGGVIHKYSLTSAITSKREKFVQSVEYAQWWMNFRGYQGIGIAAFDNAPEKFDGETMEGIRWKVETPLEGFSSPVVYGGMIFLTGGTRDSRQVFCFDVEDGKLLWTYDVKVAGSDLVIPKVDKETGFAAPTAACDGKQVYAIFATGELVALSLKGRLAWSKNLGVPENHYGHASSLITHNGLLFVQLDQYDTGKLLAIDGKTGRTVWEAERTILSWGSPICVNVGDHYELIVVDNEAVTSYDPMTGAKLWSKDCLYGEVGPSAAFAGGAAFAANEYAVAAGIDIINKDDEGSPAMRFEWRGSLPNTASPASVDSVLILATSSGTVTCLDNRTGEVFWQNEFERGFYSSPIVVGNNIFLFDRDGKMHIFAAAAEFELIGEASIGEPVVTTPAVLDGYIIVRGEKYLYRIDGI